VGTYSETLRHGKIEVLDIDRGYLGRLDRSAQDQTVGDADVPLVAVESLGLALAAVTHLGIADGDHPIRSYTLLDAWPSVGWVWFRVLIDHSAQ